MVSLTVQLNTLVAGFAIALAEMLEFGKAYHGQVIKNARALATALQARGFTPLCEHKGYTAFTPGIAIAERVMEELK